MHSKIVTELDDGDRLICTAHDDGSLSIHSGSSRDGNGVACICIPYAAVLVTIATIQAGVEKAKALRKIHYPETPPCEPDTALPTTAPSPAEPPSTDADAPEPDGSSG